MSPAPIPALSIRQPWAELILRQEKDIEIRTWSTEYRGWLWLHTGRERPGDPEIDARYGKLYRGGYVGRILLSSIVSFDRERWELWKPNHLDTGEYQPGLFAWLIGSAVRFHKPIPGAGRPGIYEPDPRTAELLAQTLDTSTASTGFV